jgi:aminoglycoside phosphotransferase (APT) family kinase protein
MADVLANLFFEAQHAIHQCASPGLDPIAARLAGRIRRAHDVSPEVRREALAVLASAPEMDTVCHGDFHPINIIVTEDRAVVIDWFDASRGDPAIDVVRTLIFLQHGRPDAVDPDFRAAFLHAYVQRCRKTWPGRIEALERWGLPLAVARLAEPIEGSERAALRTFVASLAAA